MSHEMRQIEFKSLLHVQEVITVFENREHWKQLPQIKHWFVYCSLQSRQFSITYK